MITKQKYVEYLLSTPSNYTCTNLAEHLEGVSHDVVSDFLSRERLTPRQLWELVRGRINDSAEAFLLADDSIQDKRHSQFIELVKRQYSGNAHGLVKGIGVVNLAHSSGAAGDFWPIDYRIYAPQADGKTKNEHFREMFLRAVSDLLVAVHLTGAGFGLAALDLSGGRLTVLEGRGDEALASELERLRPAEVLVPEGTDHPLFIGHRGLRPRPPWHFDLDSAQRLLARQFGTRDLAGFGCDDLPFALAAAGCLVQYAQETQRGALPHLRTLSAERREDALLLDAATRRNLELETRLTGGTDNTLAAVLDRTATAMGSRLLRRWLGRPLRDRALLRGRHHAVGTLAEAHAYDGLHDLLRGVGDMERILARVALKTARPRDLAGLRTDLGLLPDLRRQIAPLDSPLLQQLDADLADFSTLHAHLTRTIVENPPALPRDGGVIKEGYDAALDELRALHENAGQYLVALSNSHFGDDSLE